MTWSPLSWVRSSVRRRSAVHSASGPCGSAVLVLQVAQAGAQVGREGRQFGRRGSIGLSRPSPRMQRAHAVDPAAPAQLGHDHGDQRDHQAQRGDQADQVAARVLAAALDEAQVVQQHQAATPARGAEHRRPPALRGGAGGSAPGGRVPAQSAGAGAAAARARAHDVLHAHVHRAAGQGQARFGLRRELAASRAGQAVREAVGALQQPAVRAAQAEREQALVLRRAVEQRPQPRSLLRRQGVGDRIRQRVGHQHAAAVQVAAEPAQRHLVHQRHGQVGGAISVATSGSRKRSCRRSVLNAIRRCSDELPGWTAEGTGCVPS